MTAKKPPSEAQLIARGKIVACGKCGHECTKADREFFGECPACSATSLPIASGGRVSEPEKHDRSYNGGEFGKGEW